MYRLGIVEAITVIDSPSMMVLGVIDVYKEYCELSCPDAVKNMSRHGCQAACSLQVDLW